MNAVNSYEPLRYNVRDTKNYYSKVNNHAISGREVITYVDTTKEEVTHVKKAIFDVLLDRVSFSPIATYDEELKGWTVSVAEIDLYGEGDTKEDAVDDLISSIHEYFFLYANSEVLAKHEPPEKQAAVIKLMRCKSDEAMREVLGLE